MFASFLLFGGLAIVFSFSRPNEPLRFPGSRLFQGVLLAAERAEAHSDFSTGFFVDNCAVWTMRWSLGRFVPAVIK